jgi:dienelactone hydrolase
MAAIDYEQTKLNDYDFELSARDTEQARVRWLGNSDQARSLRQPMTARRDAPTIAGKFPVVIYAPSFGARAHENADLCEYLASHGYIVIATRSMGSRSVEMTEDQDGVEAQAADIGFLVGYAQSLPNADADGIAVVGYSWGGLASILASARSNRIKALVGLDSAIHAAPDWVAGLDQLRPSRTAVPLLALLSKADSAEVIRRRVQSYPTRMVYSDVYLATLLPMAHSDFSSWALRFDDIAAGSVTKPADVFDGYRWGARYIRQFLDAYLKQDDRSRAFLKNAPEENGVPAGMLQIEVRLASFVAPSPARFLELFRSAGYRSADSIYQSMITQAPDFLLNPLQLHKWGHQLLDGGNAQAAIELLKLATKINPDFGAAFDSLGGAYEASGDKALAIDAYQRALAVDKLQGNSAARLRALHQCISGLD